jgi:tRNA A-37 threonylcarbamoyl transferase component Bud32
VLSKWEILSLQKKSDPTETYDLSSTNSGDHKVSLNAAAPALSADANVCEITYDCMVLPLLTRLMLALLPILLLASIFIRAFGHYQSFGFMLLSAVLFLLTLTPLLVLLRRRYATIKISPTGLSFSKTWRYSLLNRLVRTWDDLHSVQLVVYHSNKQIHWRGDKLGFKQTMNPGVTPSVVIDFESGGNATINLCFLTRQQAEQLFRAIELWGNTAKFSSDIVSLEKSILLEKPQSYTQIWEEDLNQRYSGTNYVPLPTNHVLQNGRYRVLMEMTAGGMSAVYLAESEAKKKVVLKEAVAPLDSDQQQRQKSRELFNREADILAKLNHAQIARVLDHFVEDERDYLVLEYIPGRTLRQVVQSGGQQKEKLVLRWTIQICEILSYLHDQVPPIIHRDLTPDNLILRDDDTIVLVDFGAANEYVGSATGTMIGKQCYMAPEQLRGKATPASDLYSLGATMHLLLTGKDPTPLSQSFPATIVPSISPALDKLVAQLTDFDQSGRPVSAHAIKEQLEREFSFKSA